MIITIRDPNLLKQLREGKRYITLIDAENQPVGTFIQGGSLMPPADFVCPYSDEEMDRRVRDNRTGRPLAEIVRDLEEKHG